MEKSEDTRYPYTYSADYIRIIGGYGDKGIRLSRSDASQIRSKIAEIIGMDDNELACKLADYYLEHQEEVDQKSLQQVMSAMKHIFGNQCDPFDETARLVKDSE